MTTSERIAVLRKFHVKLRMAEHRGERFEICRYTGCVNSTEHLLVEEDKLTQADIAMLRKEFDAEIEKAGIEADQFVALYHST